MTTNQPTNQPTNKAGSQDAIAFKNWANFDIILFKSVKIIAKNLEF